ncbi:Carbohydrate deacetylase [Balamuthia mandrillaris]
MLQQPPQHRDGRRRALALVVTADDLGYGEERDRGIFQLWESKEEEEGAEEKGGGPFISGASLLCNGRTAEEAVKRALSCGLPLNLHLNLTEGAPLCPPGLVPSLCDSSGEMLGKFGFRKALAEGHVSLSEVEQEVRAQLAWFKQRYFTPLLHKLASSSTALVKGMHVDGHQHVHVLPQLVPLLASLFKEYNVLSTRLPNEDLSNCSWMPQGPQRTFLEEVSSQAESAKAIYASSSIHSTDAFLGLSLMGSNSTAEHIFSRLDSIISSYSSGPSSPPRHIEWMVHPGYKSTAYGDDFSRSEEREHEMRILSSPELRSGLLIRSLHLISFPDFMHHLQQE